MKYPFVENQFKTRLNAHELTIGCWSSSSSHVVTELVGLCGFDWVMFDCEHSPNDVSNLVPQLMALKGSTTSALVRPYWNDPVLFKRLLDIGCTNFLVPMVESREEAERAVAATRYPLGGTRGLAVSHRGNYFGMMDDYLTRINDNIGVIVQIESGKGVENLEEIIQVPGVDGIFIGPSDLSSSLGYLGNPGHPEVVSAIAHIIETCRKYGKPVGTVSFDPRAVEQYIAQGMSFVAIASDLGVLKNGLLSLTAKFKD
ncbi:2-dehydro-3-deoxyglucarate aldolase [Citrobacter freundii complex sp. CFNIH2]|uniref:aldolase/citrate lyase family protein n=1 Tax=Citrobacter freundii complex sp. CFNIH2 TaxID=2066049 RepID=UPI000C86C2D2|nr:aldolase/citrate lyase family protein [Citrobacter freundii complex sp. CFNIH2]AUO67422.1 2-dehydro-3-deoxyglucarate aldolase [Citrobacter freundii complex sp. CFNIH2]